MKHSKDGYELGMSKLGIVALGIDDFNNDVEDLRQQFIEIREGRQDSVINPFISEMAGLRGNCLENGISQLAYQVLMKDAPKGVEIDIEYEPEPYRLPQHKMCASLDAMLNIRNGYITVQDASGGDIQITGRIPLEIKTDAYDSDVPKPMYVIQLTGQMMCTGATHGIIAKLGPKVNEFRMIGYECSPTLVSMILDSVDEFWERVETNTPYERDFKPYKPEAAIISDPEQSKSLVSLATEMEIAKSKVKEWEGRLSECKERVATALYALDEEVVEATFDGKKYRLENKVITRKPTPPKMIEAKPESTYVVTNVKVME